MFDIRTGVRFTSKLNAFTAIISYQRLVHRALCYKTPRIRAYWLHCTLVLVLTLSGCSMNKTSNFDSDTWKSQRGVQAADNQRGEMLTSLKAVIKTGMPRADVIKLLGEPDTVNAEAGTHVYELGVSELGIDEEYYEIRYQDESIVSHRWARR